MRQPEECGLDESSLDIFDEVVVVCGLVEAAGGKGRVLDGDVQQLREADFVGHRLHRLILIHPQQLLVNQLQISAHPPADTLAYPLLGLDVPARGRRPLGYVLKLDQVVELPPN